MKIRVKHENFRFRRWGENCSPILLFIVSCLSIISTCVAHPPEYDFIVVGGGIGGCVVAARLADSGRSVLLLHDGGYPDPQLDIPALTGQELSNNPAFLKNFLMVPQQNAALATNGTMSYTVGRALGGGSAVNGMVWHRGSTFDFDNYAKIANDESWKYEKMLKYFRKSENYEGRFHSDEHGYGGPITVSSPVQYAPQQKEWLDAGRYLGYPILDSNPQRVSFAPIEFSMKFGRRVSAYSGYIKSNPKLESSGKLRIMTNSPVSRIIFQGTKALGVTYKDNSTGQTRFVRARKEVIISSGVIGSPALLMRSGVGPKDVLDKTQISPVKYLPVGKNFQDHTLLILEFLLSNTSAVVDPVRDLTEENWKLYNETGDGPFAKMVGTGNAEALIASSSQKRAGQGSWPDIQIYNMVVERQDDVASQPVETGEGETLSLAGILARGKSRGRILLNPENVDGDPIVDFQFLSHPDDLGVMLESVEMMLKIYERTPSMQGLGARLVPNPIQACAQFKFRSKAYWRCYIGQRALTGLHAVGSCSLGAGWTDPNAVVDSEFRVVGIDKLRIVDASVIPRGTSANPQASVYAIAEKAAEAILMKWRHRP